MDYDAFYFGTVDNAGHYFFTTTGQRLPMMMAADVNIPWNEFDTGLLPKDHAAQGHGQFHIKGSWVAISIHDYTVDPRPGSHSTFFLRGGYRNVSMLLEELRTYPFFASILDRIGDLDIVVIEE